MAPSLWTDSRVGGEILMERPGRGPRCALDGTTGDDPATATMSLAMNAH